MVGKASCGRLGLLWLFMDFGSKIRLELQWYAKACKFGLNIYIYRYEMCGICP